MLHPLRSTSLCGLTALLLTMPPAGWAETPVGPQKSDRCPICGMFVAPYPDWVATLVFHDGSQLFFDGPKDLFRYYFALPTKDDSRSHADIAAIYLTEYYSTRRLPAQQLYFILGSNIFGPMGAELIPVAGKAAAEGFMVDHHGQKLLRFDQLRKSLLPAE